jgi:hypothetical protein
MTVARIRSNNYHKERRMIAEDLGLSLLASPYDPDLAKIGIFAPRLTARQKLVNSTTQAGKNMQRNKRALNGNLAEGRKRRAEYMYRKSVEAKIARQEVASILRRFRRMGVVGER